MDLGLHDPGQLAQMLECRVELSAIIRIGIAGHQFADAGHHGAQLGKVTNRFVRAFRQVNDVLAIEQAFDESIQFLEPDMSKLSEICSGGFHRRASQAKWVATLLVPGQAIPEAINQCADQLVGLVHAIEHGKFAAPEFLDHLQR